MPDGRCAPLARTGTWTPGAIPQFDKGIRHPGLSCGGGAGCAGNVSNPGSATTAGGAAEAARTDRCSSYVRDPSWRDFDVTFPAHAVAMGTSYVKLAFTFPESDVSSVVRYSIVNLNPNVVHHMLLYRCDSDQSANFGTPVTAGGMPCSDLMWAWAVGGGDMCMPPDVGFEITSAQVHTTRSSALSRSPTLSLALTSPSPSPWCSRG